eukprot:scaffold1058_cov51-Phaeocystis_antarctica.AAC.1
MYSTWLQNDCAPSPSSSAQTYLLTHVLLSYYQVSFVTIAPKLCTDGLDLLTQMLRYEPGQRISAKAAMSHPYFKELDQTRFKAV